jgi:reverse transcriptase-like protein
LNKKWFTKFDVRWGYNNICIKNGDQWKAAFKMNKGLYKPMVMFFGLTNSPATFQTMMDDIFCSEVAQGYIIIYMDNILITTEGNLKDHQKYVAHVLNILLKHDLYLKPEKCSFHKKEVEYLGVIVGNGKVKMDPTKVQVLTDWPQPTTLKQLHLFLGFRNYYKDFIVDYSRLARPLHELTKKSVKYFWGTPQQQAFKTLKCKFTSYPVLRNPDNN